MENLDCNKLNECLKEIECLNEIITDYKKFELILIFTCPNGGCYEDVNLRMVFELPSSFHLPFRLEAQENFQVYICDDNEKQTMIDPIFTYEEDYVMRFRIDNKLSPYYINFSSLKWRLEGNGPIKNQYELIGEDDIEIADLPEGFEETVSKFGNVFMDTLKSTLKETNIDQYLKFPEEEKK